MTNYGRSRPKEAKRHAPLSRNRLHPYTGIAMCGILADTLVTDRSLVNCKNCLRKLSSAARTTP
jgi:hypothetical protein